MATAKKTAPVAAKKTAPVAAKSAPVAAKSAPAKKAAVVEQPAETEAAAPRTRGPRGVPETAVITVLAEGNPKREGSKAHAVFSHYENGQTIADFCAALEATDAEMVKEATPNLVYDAKHGFIEIEGYEPPGGVIEKKVREPKAPKAAKAPKAGKAKPTAEQQQAQADADAEAEEEVVD